MIFGRVIRYTNAVRVHLNSGPISLSVTIVRRNIHLLPDIVLVDEARIVLGREAADLFGDVVVSSDTDGDLTDWTEDVRLSELAMDRWNTKKH